MAILHTKNKQQKSHLERKCSSLSCSLCFTHKTSVPSMTMPEAFEISNYLDGNSGFKESILQTSDKVIGWKNYNKIFIKFIFMK